MTGRIWYGPSNCWRGLLPLDRDQSNKASYVAKFRSFPRKRESGKQSASVGITGSRLARGRAEALPGPSAFPVRRFRIKNACVAKFELGPAQLALGRAERHGAIKTRPSSGMAGAGDLFDLDPNRVLVAIDAHVDDALRVAGGLAFFPQR